MKTPPTDDHGPQAPLLQTLALARPAAGRLALATLLGAGAVAAAIGLIATSAWLISRSAQHPQESAVAIAIVGVQFFALSRGLCRYAERVVGHDAAFRVLSDLRVSVYERLERLAPLGLPAFGSGDLLARLIGDIDSLQDLLLRVVPPFAIALLVGAATVGLVWWMLPAAGLILLVALLIAGTLVPWLTGTLAARTEARQAAARGELTASVVDLIEGAPELAVNGATAEQLGRAMAADTEVTRLAGTAARTAGIGQGLTSLCVGLAMWGALAVGVSAVHAGRLEGVLLAGIALIPLVAFELVTGAAGRDADAPARTPLGRAGVRGDGYAAARAGARAPGRARRRATCSESARPALLLPGPDAPGARRRGPRSEPRPARGGGRTERRRQVDARRGTAALPPLRGRLGHARWRGARRARRRRQPARGRARRAGRTCVRQHARGEPAPGQARSHRG